MGDFDRTMTFAPKLQSIDELGSVKGVVVKESKQVIDAVAAAVSGAYEAANRYYVFELPSDKKPASDHGEPGSWLPSTDEINSLKQLLLVQEESSCCLRVVLALCGGLNLRRLQLHYYGAEGEAMRVERPCRLGACCGPCCRLSMTLHDAESGAMVGAVEEDCDSCPAACWARLCLCTCTHKVLLGASRESLVHKYSLRNSAACCGRVNNCCGSTCCKPNYFIDVLEPNGEVAAVIQKTFGAGGINDFLRCIFDFTNYVMPFPPKATPTERAALLTALLSVEYAYFSRQGGDK